MYNVGIMFVIWNQVFSGFKSCLCIGLFAAYIFDICRVSVACSAHRICQSSQLSHISNRKPAVAIHSAFPTPVPHFHIAPCNQFKHSLLPLRFGAVYSSCTHLSCGRSRWTELSLSDCFGSYFTVGTGMHNGEMCVCESERGKKEKVKLLICFYLQDLGMTLRVGNLSK